MGDWEQGFDVSGPLEGGEVIVGVQFSNMPSGGEFRFMIPAGEGVPPFDSGWLPVHTANQGYGVEQRWPARAEVSMKVEYRPAPNASVFPFVGSWAAQLGPGEHEVIEALENWTTWSFPLTGPAAGNIVLGVACQDVKVGSKLRFTTVAGGDVPAMDTGVRTIVTPSESIGILQSWPAAHLTTMEVTFTAAGGLPLPGSALKPFLAQVVQDGPYTRLQIVWTQTIALTH